MKKRKIPILADIPVRQNPVAKHAHQFNKPQIFVSKKVYSRKAKHVKQEVSPIRSLICMDWQSLLFISRLFCPLKPRRCFSVGGQLTSKQPHA